MKMLDKIKNLFTEEVEVEEPIKKEVTQVEIPAPAVKPTPAPEKVETEKISDANISREEKFKFPVYFDDADFSDLEPKKEVKPATIKPVKKETPVYGGNKPLEKQEKKQFKPTPIISPVYGVLDKNYHKEDIVHKPKSVIRTNDSITVDDIRNKAYGTLEDDLENTLFGKNSILFDDVVEEEKQETDMFEELMIEPEVLNEEVTEEVNEEVEVESIEDNIVAEAMNEEVDNDNKLSDSDLFNLIDTIYEKGDNNDN